MEQETILKEILQAFKLYSEKNDEKLDVLKNGLESRMDSMRVELESKMDSGFNQVYERLDRLEKKFDGMRVEITANKETIDFVLNKTAQHERKLQQLMNQQL